MKWKKYTDIIKNSTLTLSLIITLFLFTTLETIAQKKWDRGASTDNWHDANNWEPDGIPNNSDEIVLDHSEFASDYTINISNDAINVEKIKINATMSDITLNVNQNVTISNGEFSLRSESGHTANLNINANITVSGGSGPIPEFGTIPSAGDKNIQANSGIIQVGRDIKFDPNTNYTSGAETWRFQGSSGSTIQTGNAITIHKLELNKSDASIILTLASELTISNNLNIQKGTVEVEDGLIINGTTFIQGQGVLRDFTNLGSISFEGATTVEGMLETNSESNVFFLSDLTCEGNGEIKLLGGGGRNW